MKENIVIFAVSLVAFVLLFSSIAFGEDVKTNEELLTTYTTDSSTENGRKIFFSYPSGCDVIIDGSHFGTTVYLSEHQYVSVILFDKKTTYKDYYNKYEEDEERETNSVQISDSISIYATQNLFLNPQRGSVDMLEVGVNLSDNKSMLFISSCESGKTEIYALLLTIMNSIFDASPIEEWVYNAWIPSLFNG